jgi:aldehyde dehydrogenase (NAD+)/coniferyl-aldehyde dehydrogenase
MRAAAANLTPVTLELGGKSPPIGPHADFERAVERILVAKLLNAGQPASRRLRAGAESRPTRPLRRGGSPLRQPALSRYRAQPRLPSIISPRHFDRLESMIAAATAAGAQAVPLTDAPRRTPPRRRLPPVLLTDVPDNVMAMQEEIFGPVLPVVTYRSIEDAIGFVNARPRPLALYVFDKSGDVVDRVMRQTVAGGVTVNDTLFHIAQDDLPFGGVGPSGMGVYHGKAGFETFSEAQADLPSGRPQWRRAAQAALWQAVRVDVEAAAALTTPRSRATGTGVFPTFKPPASACPASSTTQPRASACGHQWRRVR